MTLCAALLMTSMSMQAQKTMTPPAGGKAISDHLIGIFFEDISSSADGGLYAELLQNGSFEYNPTERDGWGAGTAWRMLRPGHSLGRMEPRMDAPLHPNNPTYMRLYIERVKEYYDYTGWKGFGLQNDGFDGMAVKAGAKYDFSVFLRNVEGNAKQVRVALVEPQGWGKDPKLLAEATFEAGAANWQKYEAQLTASENSDKAVLQMLVLNTGTVDVDMMSLMPADTYKGHGLRKDLAEALEALHPKFMRFPGGCVVHGGGDGFWNTYRWKTTVGPKEQRRPLKNTWGYHQSMGLGYYEYFQFCEDLGMEPLPILPCGVSCQGTNGGWFMKDQAQEWVPMEEMDEWVDDALDLIEWANGDATTKWGRVRAEAGHPKPFGLKYLGIGNEERISPEFTERFKYMYNKIKAAHPEIIIVGTAGPGSHAGNPDYENGWKLAEEINLPILDEHYYEQRDYFLSSRQYDNYPRDRKAHRCTGRGPVPDSCGAQRRRGGNDLLRSPLRTEERHQLESRPHLFRQRASVPHLQLLCAAAVRPLSRQLLLRRLRDDRRQDQPAGAVGGAEHQDPPTLREGVQRQCRHQAGQHRPLPLQGHEVGGHQDHHQRPGRR